MKFTFISMQYKNEMKHQHSELFLFMALDVVLYSKVVCHVFA